MIYLPLGGAGEIGMNAYVYGYGPKGKERLILVDLGVTFPDMDGSPGVDLIFPDMAWLEERRDRLEAIFITHAHEDHIGAIGQFWSNLQVPVYCRKFTARIAERKLEEQGLNPDAVHVVERYPARTGAGPFEVSFLPVSHSIPEAAGLIIDTPAGRVVHTGDFKLDRSPVLGEPFDPDLWSEIAGQGVKALVCDSTNVFSRHAGRSEATVMPAITELVSGAPGMVVATTFASNIARLKTLAEAGQAAGRSVCLLGRAMQRMLRTGVETGIVTDFPPVIDVEDAVSIPRENLMLIVTGSQGERRAASAQLSRGKHLGLTLKEGDLFLFSSKTIPGNERGVIRIMNAFSEMGVDVIDDSMGEYHVSGHANRPDLQEVHRIFRPDMLIPMHGEHRHLREHARLAREGGLAAAVAVNGTMLDLTGTEPEIVDYVETGRVYLDGSRKIGALDGIVRDRIRMALNGVLAIAVLIDEEDEYAAEIYAAVNGLSETGEGGRDLAEEVEDAVSDALSRAKRKVLTDDDAVEAEVRKIARRVASDDIGKKPEVIVQISRFTTAP